MKRQTLLVDGLSLDVDRLIGKGGEGEVYLVANDPSKVVKLYTSADRNTREAKILAMVRSGLAQKAPLAAFPLAVVRNSEGVFAGFLMRLAKGHRPIHELYAPGSRKQHFPAADYRFLVRTAVNIAKAFAAVHQTGCVVGDINHSGLLVSASATAVLIDADSFQFTADGRQYLCRVGVPEYTPPELQGKPLHGIVRTTDHDAFGLAVVLFQMLLMGRHPFVGRVRHGEMPSDEERIKGFRYVYAEDHDVGMDQPPGTPALSDFSIELARLFNRAFSRIGVGRRPSAEEWVFALERFEGSLVRCSDNGLHFHSKDASECAWCEMERQLQTTLFLPYVSNANGIAGDSVATGSGLFDLQMIWAKIDGIKIPSWEQLRPILNLYNPMPSDLAHAALTQKEKSTVALGVGLLVAAAGLLVLAPKAGVLAALLAIWGFVRLKPAKSKPLDSEPFLRAYRKAKLLWYQELDGWSRRTGWHTLHEIREKLTNAKSNLIGLAADEDRQIREYKVQREGRQLQNYLEGFDIARADLKGIGHAKLAALSSYGIDTAADVRYERVLNVPGFGDALTRRLLEWRQRHESRFVFNPADTEADRREIARIRALIEGKSAPLKTILTRGAQELEMRVLAYQKSSRIPDAALQRAHELVEQARKDLQFLRLSEPHVPPPTLASRNSTISTNGTSRSQPLSQPPVARGVSSQVGLGASLSCPRCGSSMRMKVARKGRNAGNNFWGCSRYPSCKGTRSI